MCFFFSCNAAHRDLHVLTHSFPTRRSSDLAGMGIGVATLSLPLTACGANDKPAPLAALKLAKRSEQAGGEKLTEFETVSTYNNYYEFGRSEEHTSELQSLMRISYAVFCLKKKKTKKHNTNHIKTTYNK